MPNNNTKLYSLSFVFCLFSLFYLLPVQSNAANKEVLRITSTTSMVSTGLMKVLLTEFEKEYPSYQIEVFATGSGNALRRARLGKADITITHSPAAEMKFQSDGYASFKQGLMTNEFVLIGPENDPAGTANAKDIISAFMNIAKQRAPFISRGDDSGTHKKELSLWRKFGVEPYGEWYIETGSGQTDAVMSANEESAYILTDIGTWLKLRKQLKLKLLLKDYANLANTYSVMLVNPKKFPSINHQAAEKFVNWLFSNKGQQIIGQYKIDGEQLFTLINKK